MFYAISWFLVLALLATWSVSLWVLHAFAAWSFSGVGLVAGQAQQLDPLAQLHWLVPWLPADLLPVIEAATASVWPWVQSALSALPSAADWLTPLAWISWGVGLLFLVMGGMLLHALIFMLRARG